MAHGQPDFGMYSAKRTVASVADNAELAARLGSIVTFDRRGDVILLDDFEDNINKWDITLSRAGASIALSNDTARNGGSSCKVVTGNVAGDEEQLARWVSYPVLSKLGLEVHFSFHVEHSMIQIALLADDGVTTFYSALRYLPPTNVLEYLAPGPAWVPLAAGLALYPEVHCFNAFKFVVDLQTLTYSRVILGPNVIPMTQAIWTPGTLVTPNTLGVFITIGTSVNFARTAYLDDVIVTQNEP